MTSFSKLPPFTVFYDHSGEYHRLKNEIFTQGVYYFETENPTPRIIDAGAHIGLATLYFKKIYPGAQLTAIEPLRANFELLEKNLFENQVSGVETHQVALAAQEGLEYLFIDATAEEWYSTASFVKGAWNQTQTSQPIEVPAQTLSSFLQHPVDFLKMDIEGAEQEVLMEAANQLYMVKHMIFEFHHTAHQSLPKLLEFLQQQGFTTACWKDGKSIQPKRASGLVYVEAQRKK